MLMTLIEMLESSSFSQMLEREPFLFYLPYIFMIFLFCSAYFVKNTAISKIFLGINAFYVLFSGLIFISYYMGSADIYFEKHEDIKDGKVYLIEKYSEYQYQCITDKKNYLFSKEKCEIVMTDCENDSKIVDVFYKPSNIYKFFLFGSEDIIVYKHRIVVTKEQYRV